MMETKCRTSVRWTSSSVVIVFCVSVCYLPAVVRTTSSASCLPVYRTASQCLTTAGNTTLSAVCPVNYWLLVHSASAFIYKSLSPVECPSSPDFSCLHSNVSANCSVMSPTCNVSVSRLQSALPVCDIIAFPGLYFAELRYRCRSVFLLDVNETTAFTVHLSYTIRRSASLIRFTNDLFSPRSEFVYSTSDYCSIYIPGNAAAHIAFRLITTTSPVADCQQRVILEQWNSSISLQFCRTENGLVELNCSDDGADRFYRLYYVTDDEDIGSQFFVDIQVAPETRIIAECGNPSVPLNISVRQQLQTTSPLASSTLVTSSSANAATSTTVSTSTIDIVSSNVSSTASPLSNSTLIGLGVGIGVVIIVILIAVIVGCWFRVRSMSSTRPFQTDSLRQQPSTAQPIVNTNTVMVRGLPVVSRRPVMVSRPWSAYNQRASYPPQSRLPPPTSSDTDERFIRVTNFYVSNNRPSQLVLDRNKSPPYYRTVLKL